MAGQVTPVDVRSQLELAWAAGHYDGEGNCFASKPKKGSYSLQLTVGSTDFVHVERFLNAVKIGKIYGPYAKGEKRKSVYYYKACGLDDVEKVIELLEPYLCEPKLYQIEEAVYLAKSLKQPVHEAQHGLTLYGRGCRCVTCSEAKSAQHYRLKRR